MKPVLFATLLLAPALAFAAGGHPSHGDPAVADGPAHGEHAAHGSHAAHDRHAAHVDPAAHPEPLPAGAPWPADAPLAAGMRRIRAATGALAHGAHGHLDAAQVDALAGELRAAVLAMFAECELPPAPDAALHPLLADVLASADALRADVADAGAHASLEGVLRRYPQLFTDPGWRDGDDD